VSRGEKTKKGSPLGRKSSRRAIRRLSAVFFTLAAVAALVWGVSRLGDEARRGIGPRDRYSVRFAEIECEPPPGLDRSIFLSEVRYCSNFPEIYQSLDPELTAKLTAAFASHPWVATVDAVRVGPDGTVQVKLKHRKPALVVRTDGGTRVVDINGVLLPASTDSSGLPELTTPVPAPTVSAGQVWVDNSVKRAVELVDTHHPIKLEKATTGWRLTMSDGKTLVLDR
jgi:cell division septal protein FtsQ